MLAIAAMSRNRVIGDGNAIPWRISDELKWFRRQTYGGVVVMGRRTFESLPRPLDGRINVVLTHHPEQWLSDDKVRQRYGPLLAGRVADASDPHADPEKPPPTEVRVAGSIEELCRATIARRAWLCGGAELYRQLLPRCSELYLSLVDREVAGDTYFPPFEHLFDLAGTVAEFPEFRVLRYVRNAVPDARAASEGESVR